MMPNERRTLVVGVAIVATALAVRGLTQLQVAWGQTTQSLRQELIVVNGARELARRLPALRDSSRSVGLRRARIDSAILGGSTEAEATTALAERAALLVDDIEVELVGLSPEPDTMRLGDLHRVTVRAQLRADGAAAGRLVIAILAVPTSIGVEALRLRAPDPAGTAATPGELDVEVILSAWYRRGAR